MKRHLGQRKRLWISLLATGVLLVSTEWQLLAASQSAAAVTVQVQPEAYLEVVSAPSWKATGDMQSLAVPLKILIRLNGGTSGTLNISMAEGVDPNATRVEVETEDRFREVSGSPVFLRAYSRSGTYQETIQIRRRLPLEADSPTGPPVLRLTSSDGSAAWSQILTLPPVVPPAQ